MKVHTTTSMISMISNITQSGFGLNTISSHSNDSRQCSHIMQNAKEITNYTFRLISYVNTFIFVECINLTNNNKKYAKILLQKNFEKFVYFEIINNSPLWSMDFKMFLSNCNALNTIKININIDTSLIAEYLGKSIALSSLLTDEYNNLPIFNKFNNNISYLPPPTDLIEQPNCFKIKLYDYQKRSLAKMIKIEKKEIDFNFQYTMKINFKNIMDINYDPIKNIRSDIERNFNIVCNGGILADEMGLGKTITTLALISANPSTNRAKLTYSEKDKYWKITSKATVIICPSHITRQWEEETKKTNPKLKILSLLTRKDHDKLFFNAFIDADIIITSHQFLMNFKYYPCLHYKAITPSMYNASHRNNSLKEYYTKNIISSDKIDDDAFELVKNHELPLFEFFNFHRLVLDEGHEIFGEMLSNVSLSRYMATWLSGISSNSKWFISGSPFINFKGLINSMKYLNLSLIDTETNFFKINSDNLENLELFNNIFNKEYFWNNILEKICIRHQKNDVTNEISLFGYDEHIEWITFTELEKKLYDIKKNNNKDDEVLQLLCCHLTILPSCRKILGDIQLDLSVIQTKLIEHHNKLIKTYTIKLADLIVGVPAYHMTKKSFENILMDSKYMISVLTKLADNKILDDTDNNCAICLENIIDGCITNCGHIFCSECIKNCLTYKKLCPICKKDLTLTDVYTLNKNKKITTDDNDNEKKILEKYGSKLGKIIVMIKKIIIEPSSRIIIFSQWDHMLSLIGQSLSENGIANSFVKGNVWARNNAVSKFKSGKTLSGDNNRIIMLSLKNSASGTNLTEATHIFFVDPINANKEECRAIEGQAIGRAVRIGQLKKVKLFRFLVKNTIEEEIYLKNL